MESFRDWSAVDNRIRPAADSWIAARTIAVCTKQLGGNLKLEGCGVLLRVADSRFVVSASHVLSAGARSNQVFLAPMVPGRNLVPVPRSRIVLTPDEYDIAIARLTEENWQLLAACGKHSLALLELDRAGVGLSQGRYAVLGHPVETTRIDYAENRVAMLPLSYWSVPCRNEPANAWPGITIALELTSHSARHPNGDTIRMPHFAGMSGCGVWKLYSDVSDTRQLARWSTDWIRLVGIEHRVTRTAILGTHIRFVAQILEEQFPDLRASMQLTLPG